ncbi:Zn-dependent hydrolase [Conexibacter sp. CPCC 206217]|uniref:Zn-dependent hydrolase n=1 Tax=Conexibacter sp. CPCC 206217 TaxID=3064574 RepID=UPI002717C889|nr:Zn-dependent hydrolase [Conexibacter sp. CPCC 206217]MDO8210158.1 Zn-dependent hydrolase [Conexibacter sp. CPCC 206217]
MSPIAQTSEAELAERIDGRLSRLARIGAQASGGVTRLAYSTLERDAHELFAAWAAEEGWDVEVDAAGNSVAVARPGAPYVLLGSHLDTVSDGGAYDGAAGVVAGLEAARIVAATVACGVRVVAFAAEEGARFGRPTLGSAAAAGLLPTTARTLADGDGETLAEAAAALGLDPWAARPWLDERVACFLEVHIEQGRQLEGGAARIGLVDAIAGSVRARLTLSGRADHSGATPMELRADALAAAAEIVLAVEAAGQRYRSTVATVGRLEVDPGSVTTVPGTARLWIDVRDVDPEVQRTTARELLARAEEIARARGILLRSELLSELAPVVLEAWPRALAHEESIRLGLPYRVLSSGAGHDAAIVARRAPSAMLFVPCADGISHSPRERASAADIACAALLAAAAMHRTDALLG